MRSVLNRLRAILQRPSQRLALRLAGGFFHPVECLSSARRSRFADFRAPELSKHVQAEEAVASTRRHDVGDRVEAREHGGADYRSATVLTATFGHYGWVYRVKFRDGHERKVVAANVRKRRPSSG